MPYLTEAIESVLAQTANGWECILVDDGSTDGSGRIASGFSDTDRRFRLISTRHAGLVEALNIGLEACRGEYIARMDADDRMLPERLARQAAFLDAAPDVALVSSLVRTFRDSGAAPPGGMREYERWLNSVVTPKEIEENFFVESPFAHPSVMMRAAAIRAAGGYADNDWAEDYDLWMRLRVAGGKFAKIPEVLLEWRDGAGRMSRNDNRYSPDNFLRLKARYLPGIHLAGRAEVTVWGAGRGGRRWRRELAAAGIVVSRFIDIDPRKIGRTVHGAPVLPPEALQVHRHGDFILATVGSRDARGIIRARLLEMGYVELKDFLFLA